MCNLPSAYQGLKELEETRGAKGENSSYSWIRVIHFTQPSLFIIPHNYKGWVKMIGTGPKSYVCNLPSACRGLKELEETRGAKGENSSYSWTRVIHFTQPSLFIIPHNYKGWVKMVGTGPIVSQEKFQKKKSDYIDVYPLQLYRNVQNMNSSSNRTHVWGIFLKCYVICPVEFETWRKSTFVIPFHFLQNVQHGCYVMLCKWTIFGKQTSSCVQNNKKKLTI